MVCEQLTGVRSIYHFEQRQHNVHPILDFPLKCLSRRLIPIERVDQLKLVQTLRVKFAPVRLVSPEMP